MNIIPRRSRILRPAITALQKAFIAGYATNTSTASLHRRPADGKSVIVTGSARGIGKSIALRLALDGYNVCINDIPANEKACNEAVQEIQALGRKSCFAVADVSKRGEVKEMIQRSVKELGPLHTMIANAGIAQVKALLDLTEQDFDQMLAVNLTGVHNCYAEAALQMIDQGTCKPDAPGKIIGAASIVAFRPFALLGHYSATKFAVRGLTQAYAMELADNNITVNAYAPGIVGTAMWDKIDAGLAAKKGDASVKKGDMMKKYAGDGTLLHRVSVPEDVAKLVSFLASSDSDFVTGQTQVVDGGIVLT